MSKRVTFNDTVEVRNISVSRDEHIQEVKNPQNLITVTSDIPGVLQTNIPPSETNYWLWIVALAILCVIGCVVWWYSSSGKNAKKNLEE